VGDDWDQGMESEGRTRCRWVAEKERNVCRGVGGRKEEWKGAVRRKKCEEVRGRKLIQRKREIVKRKNVGGGGEGVKDGRNLVRGREEMVAFEQVIRESLPREEKPLGARSRGDREPIRNEKFHAKVREKKGCKRKASAEQAGELIWSVRLGRKGGGSRKGIAPGLR